MPKITPEFQKLWLLLLKEPVSLTDKEIDDLLTTQRKLSSLLQQLVQSFPWFYSTIKKYRERKRELSQLPTAELEKQYEEIRKRQAAVIATDHNDDLPDSFFEGPPLDSDEHIIYELLEERKKKNKKKT